MFPQLLNSDSPLHESVGTLLELVNNREEDVLFQETAANVKHVYSTIHTESAVTDMLNEVTLFAARKIMEARQDVKLVQCRPETTIESCGCTHFIHTFLPCAHIMKLRVQEGKHTVVVRQSFPEFYDTH